MPGPLSVPKEWKNLSPPGNTFIGKAELQAALSPLLKNRSIKRQNLSGAWEVDEETF